MNLTFVKVYFCKIINLSPGKSVLIKTISQLSKQATQTIWHVSLNILSKTLCIVCRCGHVLDTELFLGGKPCCPAKIDFSIPSSFRALKYILTETDLTQLESAWREKKHTWEHRVSLPFWAELVLQWRYSTPIIWLLRKKSGHRDNLSCASSWLVSKTYIISYSKTYRCPYSWWSLTLTCPP